MNYSDLKLEIVNWLTTEVNNAKAKGVVFGLSGGIDSAVIAALSYAAFQEDALGIMIPIHSNPKDKEDALLIAHSVGLTTKEVDLSETFDQLMGQLDKTSNAMAVANIKPRLRMTVLYYYAQNMGYLVLGCSNLSEFMTGYFTKFGDSGADLLPLASLYKTEIWQLAEELKLPPSIIHKAPTAGLWENQTDEAEMGFSYQQLDQYLMTGKADAEVAKQIDRMVKNSEHKRSFAKMFQVKDRR